jgi:hypothetical protein
MFGGSVAFVYAALMQANIVYTLFFATAIVCGARGAGWWAVHFYNRYRARQRAGARVPLTAAADTAPLAA